MSHNLIISNGVYLFAYALSASGDLLLNVGPETRWNRSPTGVRGDFLFQPKTKRN
jgi:hypothetical protein